jgi:hypothetical protein
MSGISSTFRAPSLLSPRTANSVAALIRQGDNFDYFKWLQKVREEESQAKQIPATFTSGKIIASEIDPPIGTADCRSASLNSGPAPMTRAAPLPKARSHREPRDKTSRARLRRRLEKIRDAWDDFQASRARDAVYGYLEAVVAIVEHYKVRRRTNRLLRHAFKFANLPFDRNADPFTAVIRCTCDGAADNKIISKWARALRYVAHCKKPRTRLKTFMKKAGGSMPALLPMQNLSGAVTDVIEGHSRLCRSPQGLWRWRAWWPRWWRFRFNQAALLRRANK